MEFTKRGDFTNGDILAKGAVTFEDNGQFVARCGFWFDKDRQHVEIGPPGSSLIVGREYRGRGLGAQVTKDALKLVHDLVVSPIRRITCEIKLGNTHAVQAISNAGFEIERNTTKSTIMSFDPDSLDQL